MPGAIRRYNEATGVPNTDDDGYHHTITICYLRAINQLLAGRWDDPLGALASDVLAAPLADRAYLMQFYSKERLFSVAARRGLVAPDLAPAPFAPKA